MTPSAIDVAQKAHRQVVFSVINPCSNQPIEHIFDPATGLTWGKLTACYWTYGRAKERRKAIYTDRPATLLGSPTVTQNASTELSPISQNLVIRKYPTYR